MNARCYALFSVLSLAVLLASAPLQTWPNTPAMTANCNQVTIAWNHPEIDLANPAAVWAIDPQSGKWIETKLPYLGFTNGLHVWSGPASIPSGWDARGYVRTTWEYYLTPPLSPGCALYLPALSR